MEVKKGYKQTEVGVIPEDWEVKEISDIAEVKSGKRLPLGTSLTEKTTPYPYIRVVDMVPGGIILGDIKYIPENVYPIIKNYRIFKSDIFISVAGTLGIIGKVPDELDGANLTENADRLTNIYGDRDYLMYILMSAIVQGKIESERTLGAQPKLALTRIKTFQIPVPPTRGEQIAIANTLSHIDALIKSMEKLIAKKRDIKRGAIQELLKPKAGWVSTTLGDIVERVIGGGTPSRYISEFWEGDIPWATVKDLTDFDPNSTQEYITKIGLQRSASHLIPKGTIIVATRIALGKAVIYDVDICINQDLKALFLKDDVNSKFLYYWFLQNSIIISDLGGGSTVKGISLQDLKKIVFIKPLYNEQTRIATILSDMDAEIAALEAKLAKYKQIKEGMMQTLLTGRIRLV